MAATTACAATEGLVDVLKFTLRKRPSSEITVSGETVTVDEARMSDAVIIRNCADAVVNVTAPKISKVLVLSCARTSVTIHSTIISGCIEVISSEDITIDASEPAVAPYTVTVDMAARVSVALPPAWGESNPQSMVASGSSTDVSLSLGSGAGATTYAVPDSMPDSSDETHTQMATFRTCHDGAAWTFWTEPIVREGIGHITSTPKLAADTARDTKNRELFESALSAVLPSGPNSAADAESDAAAPAEPRPSGGLADAIAGFDTSSLNRTETKVTTTASVIEGLDGGQYGHANEEDIQEYEESPEVVQAKVKELAFAMRMSSHAVAYTGAGISVSAGLRSYRGPDGVWTLRAKGIVPTAKIRMDQAEPTVAHTALATMINAPDCALVHVTSTNLDGLHRASGVPKHALSELHGNCYLELCPDCGADYERDFDTTRSGTRSDHKTGRVCEVPGCSGELRDCIVNFGESLPQDHYASAYNNASESDLALVLGTSMLVAPACELPAMVKTAGKTGRLAIVNLQKTPYDHLADIRIFAKTDDVMALLAAELGLSL